MNEKKAAQEPELSSGSSSLPDGSAEQNSEKKQPSLKKRMKAKFKRRRIRAGVEEHLAERYKKEKRFKRIGFCAIALNIGILVFLSVALLMRGAGAMTAHYVTLDSLHFSSEDNFSPFGALNRAGGREMSRTATREAYLTLESRAIRRDAAAEIAAGAETLTYKLSSEADVFLKRDGEGETGRITEGQAALLQTLSEQNRISSGFNTEFWTQGDSNYPEYAGIWAGAIGMLLAVGICMAIALPAGVATAVYLEEFAPKNRLADIIEININNLAAVPSIIFGLLGLTLYISVFGVPRSSALAGGLTLSMMALPVIVIATRSALRAVPGSVRDGALALGATRMQAVFHHVLPLAAPGMITGLVLGVARVIGETAPLLPIGMAAFILTAPESITDPATTLPVQIYMWSDRPEAGFVQAVSAAIAVLLAVLFILNTVANYFRVKYNILR